jgi:hypothetical protein
VASLSDLAAFYAPPARESGFKMADIELATNLINNQAGVSNERILRNFGQFDLPDMLGSQASRGAFHSSATEDKRRRLQVGAGDQLADVELGLAEAKANLATNGLLAQTGISLGGMY